MIRKKNTIPTLTQKYNDLHALVKKSYADKCEQEEVWQSIRNAILDPNDSSIQANVLDFFETFIEQDIPIAHRDIYIRRDSDMAAQETITPLIMSGEIEGPWCMFMTRYDPDGENNRLIFKRNDG